MIEIAYWRTRQGSAKHIGQVVPFHHRGFLRYQASPLCGHGERIIFHPSIAAEEFTKAEHLCFKCWQVAINLRVSGLIKTPIFSHAFYNTPAGERAKLSKRESTPL